MKNNVTEKIEDGDRRTREKLKKSEPAYKLGLYNMIKVVEPRTDLFQKAVDYRIYRTIKRSARNDDDAVLEIHRMAKTISIQMKYRIVFGKDSCWLSFSCRNLSNPAAIAE